MYVSRPQGAMRIRPSPEESYRSPEDGKYDKTGQ